MDVPTVVLVRMYKINLHLQLTVYPVTANRCHEFAE